MLHHDTTLSIEILDLVDDLMYWFVKHLSVTWTKLCVYFATLHLFPICFDEIKCVWCIFYSDPCVPSSGNFYKLFGIWNFFTRIIKYKQILSSVNWKFFNQVKIYSLDKFKIFSLHLTLKRLIRLKKVKKFVKCWLKSTNFQPIRNKMRFSRSTWTN